MSGTNVIGTGPVLVLNGLTETTTVFAQNLKPIEGQEFQLGPAQHQGNKYNAAFVNGGLLFEVLEPILLEEFTVHTDSAGTRIIEISNGSNFYYEHQVDLDSGTTVVTLDLDLPVGAYTITTNGDLNNLVFGSASPWLFRSSEAVSFPYEVSGVVSITTSTFGDDFYYYFYDWKISTSDRYCGSDLVPVTAVEDFPIGTKDPAVDELFIVSPNPNDGLTTVKFRTSSEVNLQLTNLDGIIIKTESFIGNDRHHIDISAYPSGIYILRANVDGQMITKKIIKL